MPSADTAASEPAANLYFLPDYCGKFSTPAPEKRRFAWGLLHGFVFAIGKA
jgi:hypothetical protein